MGKVLVHSSRVIEQAEQFRRTVRLQLLLCRFGGLERTCELTLRNEVVSSTRSLLDN